MFDKLHVQELKPETRGLNSVNESNILCVVGSLYNKGVCGFSKFSAKQLYSVS